MSSNGSGLGHLTRLLAIAGQLPSDFEPVFLTMSSGVKAVMSHGYGVDYVPGPRSGALRSTTEWLHYLRARTTLAIRTLEPVAVVFDGTYVYGSLVHTLGEFPEIFKVWSRRAMWKPIDDRKQAQMVAQTAAFDLVIEPGEFAGALDTGFTTRHRERVVAVDPVVLVQPSALASREDARAQLGIDPGHTAVLMNLGAGNINSIDKIVMATAEVLQEREDVHLVAARSIIAQGGLPDVPGRISTVETYPLARMLRAFDFCVSASGYNSFHELLAHCVPTLFIPNEETILDDQVLRASWGEANGVNLVSRADDLDGLRVALHRLLEPDVRSALQAKCRALAGVQGGTQAARLIVEGIRAKARYRASKNAEEVIPVASEPPTETKNSEPAPFASAPYANPLTRMRRVWRRGIRSARRTVRAARRSVRKARRTAKIKKRAAVAYFDKLKKEWREKNFPLIRPRLDPTPTAWGPHNSGEPHTLIVIAERVLSNQGEVVLSGIDPKTSIVLVPPLFLQSVGRHGYKVEIAPDYLCRAATGHSWPVAYEDGKLRMLRAAYNCRRVEYLGDVPNSRSGTN